MYLFRCTTAKWGLKGRFVWSNTVCYACCQCIAVKVHLYDVLHLLLVICLHELVSMPTCSTSSICICLPTAYPTTPGLTASDTMQVSCTFVTAQGYDQSALGAGVSTLHGGHAPVVILISGIASSITA